MLRSIGSVVLGYVVLALITIGGTSAAAALLLPRRAAGSQPGMPPPLTPSYLTANLTLSALAAVVGGYVTARMAPARPMVHVAVLALLIVALSILSSRSPMSTGQPRWYQRALPVIGLAGAAVGGLLGTA
jgi:small-conductance mechanosensitive channel